MAMPSRRARAARGARRADQKSAPALLLIPFPPRIGDGRFALDPEFQYVSAAGHETQLRFVDDPQRAGELLRSHRRTQRHCQCRYAAAEVTDIQGSNGREPLDPALDLYQPGEGTDR